VVTWRLINMSHDTTATLYVNLRFDFVEITTAHCIPNANKGLDRQTTFGMNEGR